LVEALVLGREDRLLEEQRHFVDAHHRATLLAELPDQSAVRGVDAQRDFRLIVDQRVDRGDFGIGDKEHKCSKQRTQHSQPGEHGHRHGEPA